jgi:hypothetical protein
MKTKVAQEQDILSITIKIHKLFPELSKYIAEMPETFSNDVKEITNGKTLKEYFNSLENMLQEYSKTHVNGDENNTIPASLTYPALEDIYNKGNKVTNEEEELWNENSFSKVGSSNGLDVPGSELDDRQESIGSEDEENNYYSLGGDGHNDLEEDKG